MQIIILFLAANRTSLYKAKYYNNFFIDWLVARWTSCCSNGGDWREGSTRLDLSSSSNNFHTEQATPTANPKKQQKQRGHNDDGKIEKEQEEKRSNKLSSSNTALTSEGKTLLKYVRCEEKFSAIVSDIRSNTLLIYLNYSNSMQFLVYCVWLL